MFECKFCGKECKNKRSQSNHSVRCKSNPNAIPLSSGTTGIPAWNKGFTKETHPVLAKMKFGGVASQEWRDANREHFTATSRKGGGYRENAGRSKKYKVLDSFGDSVCLQSSYEYRFMEVLNKEGIKWIRPKHLKYDDRKYFADFYLPDYNLYVDTKNDYKALLDTEKLQKVREQNAVDIELVLLSDLTEYENAGWSKKRGSHPISEL